MLVGELITETCELFRQLHSITRHHRVEKMLEDYLQARQNNYNNTKIKIMCLRPQVSSYTAAAKSSFVDIILHMRDCFVRASIEVMSKASLMIKS